MPFLLFRFPVPTECPTRNKFGRYTGALNNGTGTYPGYITSEMVFDMRLAQAAGAKQTPNASAVATYDLSDPTSPYGSVHNPEKGPIGRRIAAHLYKALASGGPASALVVDGPRAVRAVAEPVVDAHPPSFKVTVTFTGGSAPFRMAGTKNCKRLK